MTSDLDPPPNNAYRNADYGKLHRSATYGKSTYPTIDESHIMGTISDVPWMCIKCYICACHNLGILTKPCHGGHPTLAKRV